MLVKATEKNAKVENGAQDVLEQRGRFSHRLTGREAKALQPISLVSFSVGTSCENCYVMSFRS